MRLLITGTTGFIGANLAGKLVREGHELFALHRDPSIQPPHGTAVLWNLANPTRPRDLPERVDAVVHLAQARKYRAFPIDAKEMFQVNVAGTAALLDYAVDARANAFCLISTGTVYEPFGGEINEDAAVSPTSYLGASKLAAEVLARPYADRLDLSILRLFFPYGPGQSGRLVPQLIERICNGLPVQLASDGEGMRCVPTFIDDIVEVISTAVSERWRNTFNVASPTVVSLRGLANAIATALGQEPIFELTDQPPAVIVPRLHRLEQRFEFTRFTPLDIGIRRTVDAQLDQSGSL